MMRGWLRGAAFAALTALGAPVAADPQILSFDDLQGWQSDDHEAALEAFLVTCSQLDLPEWAPVCKLAADRPGARRFFELMFRPVLIGGDQPALFTGYYEPELIGSPVRTAQHLYPIYRKPPELVPGQQWYDRDQIEELGLLRGRGLEIAWLDDPVDVFFLQIQGSGRIHLTDGRSIRVGYAAKNGHPYKSVGQELVRRGIYQSHQVSAQVIRNWVRRNGEFGRRLLRHNPSFVFFRPVEIDADTGPIGAMGRPVTGGRSIAVDPDYTPLGAPVWVEKDGVDPLRRLMIAQDTGSAIKGMQRADIFVGTGARAGEVAGRMRDGGRMIVLLPIERALALAPEG